MLKKTRIYILLPLILVYQKDIINDNNLIKPYKLKNKQTNEALDYSNPKTYEIGGIMVIGADNLNNSTLISISELTVGNKIKIPGDNFSIAITKL